MNFDALRENFQRHGVAAGMHDLTKKAVNRIVPTRVLRVVKLTTSTIDRSLLEVPSGYTAGFVDERKLRAAAADARLMMDVAFLNGALARGDRCFGIEHGGALVSYGWYSARSTPISEALAFSFDPDWYYMYKGFTVPEHRGSRLHGIGMGLALEQLVREGRKGLLSYIESNNFASLKSSYRLGYEDVGTIVIVTINGKPRTFATPSCRAYGVSVEPVLS